MRISIVTVCYNSERYIRSAMDSVIGQSYKDIEYILVDGGSKDKTCEIIKSYGDKVSKFVSEKDKGIYDAMNKGLRMASGEYVGILNSDDFYMNSNVLEKVAEMLKLRKTDSLYADLLYVDTINPQKEVRFWKTGEFKPGSFKRGWHPAHPTFFVKKSIYEKFGYFNLDFKLSADFEIMLRFLEKHKISSCYLPEPIVRMRLGGATNKSIGNIIKQNKECFRSFKLNGLPVSFLYPIYRLAPKLLQYINKS